MIKKYSIWIEKTKTGKYKFSQRYVDPLRSTADHIVYKKVSVTLTKKTAQAKRKAEEMLAQKIANKTAESSKGSDITFVKLAHMYIDNLRKTNQPFNTIKSAYYVVNNRLIKDVGERTIAKNITPAFVNKLLTKYLYKDNLANKTVKSRQFFFSAVFEYGIDQGLLKVNPVKKARVKFKDETNRKKKRIEEKYLTDEEARAVIGFYRHVLGREDYADLVEFMLLTGMRFSEIAGLKSENIIKDNDGLWVAQVIGSNNYLLRTIFKTGERNTKSDRAKTPAGFRNVILNDRALKIAKRNINKSDVRLFINKKSGRVWNVTNVNIYLKKTARWLGISKPLSTHFFRHTYISKLTELGVPLNVIMQQVGQADSKVTKEIYTHVTENEKMNLGNRLSNLKL